MLAGGYRAPPDGTLARPTPPPSGRRAGGFYVKKSTPTLHKMKRQGSGSNQFLRHRLEAAHRFAERLAGEGVDHAHVVHHRGGSHHSPLELFAGADLIQLAALAAQQHEAAKVAPVRRDQHRFEAVDLSLLLQPAVVFDRLLEDLKSLLLAAPHDGAPTQEQRFSSHLAS